ncbi:MAG: DUF1190 domain-containing protein [Deltaproteobacteria bacterium]|nr:DUF1190 domain-containing protein [Deltaproteobacteria bacterium]
MKKGSRSLSLVLMGSLTVAVGGCGSDEPTEDFRAYQSIDECVKEQIFTQQECRDMAIAAVRQNPQFADKAECEREFGEGNCTQPQQNVQGEQRQGSWMPLLAGYMVGRYLGGNGMMQGAQPLYRQDQAGQQGNTTAARTSGGFRTLGGAAIQTDAGGKVVNPNQTVRQGFAKSAKPYAARGGLGSRGGFSGSKGFGSSGS